MSLKSKINKADFDALPDALKEHYIADGEGYKLDTTEARELLAAKQQEKDRADKLARDLATVREEMETIKGDLERAKDAQHKKENDIPAIEASWKEKVEAAKKAGADALARAHAQLRALLVRSEAVKLAHEISTAPDLLLPHIEKRLDADLEGEIPKTRVLDADGKPTAKSLEEFRSEIVDNPAFAAIMIGSKGSGGSADNRKPSTGGSAPGPISKMSEQDRRALHAKIGDDEFNRRMEAERASVRH